MVHEQWCEIEGFPNYAISNYGYVLNTLTDQFIQGYDSGDGHLRVTLYREHGKRQALYIHQLVARAFFGEFAQGMHIAHVNGDLNNNRANNLRLKRPREQRDRRDNQRDGWGQMVRVVDTGVIFDSVRDCANAIGGDYSSIYQCLRGQRKHHMGLTFEWFGE